MKKLLVLALALSPVVLISQASLDDLKFNVFQNLNSTANQNYIRLMNEQERGEEGTQSFLFDNWQKATVTSKNDEILELDSLNYHIEDQNMFFMHKGKMYFLFPSVIENISVADRNFMSLHVKDKERAHNPYQFYEILVKGELNLLKKHEIEKRKVNDHPMGISSGIEKYDYYSKSKLYYANDELSVVEELPRSKKNIIKIFKRNRNRMVEYARENNASPKSESDMVGMFSYYNSIKSK
jgi:hypothetical protein